MSSPHLPAVEGYAARLSYEPGDQVALHLAATRPHRSGRIAPAETALPVDVEIARLGSERHVVARIDGLVAEPHEIPDDAAAAGARWPAIAAMTVGDDWRSGWYEVLLRATRPDGSVSERRAGFVVRAGTGRSRRGILLELSTNTWNAYNDWGGPNLYTGGHAVSFRRPFAHGLLARPDAHRHRNAVTADEPDLGGDAWTAHWRDADICSWSACAGWPTWEGPFVVWAEANGYALDYAITAVLAERPSIVDGYALVLSVGHDEYWSSPMRDTIEGRIAGGGNVAFLSGNTSFWQVRLEDDGDTMIGYKGDARRQDPRRKTHPHLLTSMWSDPIIGRPESAMTGVSFTRGGYARIAGGTPRGQRGYSVWRPGHWLFEGTDLHYGDVLGGEHVVVGYECDGCELTLDGGLPAPTGADGSPPGFTVLGSAPARLWSVDAALGVNEYPTGLQAMRTVGELEGTAHVLFGDASPANVARIAHGNAVLGSYERNGGTVVTTGCTDWSYGLAGGDPLVERVTRNILDRLSGG